MFPTFPAFKLLDCTDRRDICAFAAQFPPYSDFTFVNLYSYNVRGDCRLCFLNGNLVVALSDYLTGQPLLTFLGVSSPTETADTLLDFEASSRNPALLRLIPDVTVQAMRQTCNGHFTILEDAANHDYVYGIPDLIELPTHALHRKEKAIHACREICSTRRIDLKRADVQNNIRWLLNKWRIEKEHSPQDVAREFSAIGRCLDIAADCNLIGVGAFDGNELVGFTINEVVHGGFYVAHFGKALPHYKGLTDLLEQDTAIVLQQYGCKYLNNEQDLGLEGLRFAKRAWQPSMFLKKFTVTRNSGDSA